MTTITRKLEFDAGHRILGHEGKCRYLHGHRYTAEITVEGILDHIGRVIDFGIVKDLVGGWIADNWDHNLLLNKDDPQLLHLKRTEERPPYELPENPTAENLAKELFNKAILLLPKNLRVLRVRMWETPNCYADYENISSE